MFISTLYEFEDTDGLYYPLIIKLKQCIDMWRVHRWNNVISECTEFGISEKQEGGERSERLAIDGKYSHYCKSYIRRNIIREASILCTDTAAAGRSLREARTVYNIGCLESKKKKSRDPLGRGQRLVQPESRAFISMHEKLW